MHGSCRLMEDRRHSVIHARPGPAILRWGAGIPWHQIRKRFLTPFFQAVGRQALPPFLAVLFVCLPSYAQPVTDLRCDSFREVGEFTSPKITECSGLAVSRKNPGVLWVHNDSGDSARLFAVKEDGTLLGVFRLAQADSRP